MKPSLFRLRYIRFRIGAAGLVIAACLCLNAMAEPAFAGETNTYYVRAEADAGAWKQAPTERVYTDLQAAIDEAAKNTPARVLVTVGVFLPASAPNTGVAGENGLHFSLRNGVSVIGGFAGDELTGVPSFENGRTEGEDGSGGNPSLLRPATAGGQRQTVLTGAAGAAHVFYHPDSAALNRTASLMNVTVSMGGGSAADGGGMFNNECSPSVISCAFTGNSGRRGGAVYNDFANPLFENCRFEENSAAEYGGAMVNVNSAPDIVSCVFSANRAAESGGAMANENSAPTVTGADFNDNATQAADGGAVFNAPGSAPAFTHCTFTGNTSARHGGAIASRDSAPKLTNCCFTQNEGLYGGALYGESGTLSATNCSWGGNRGSGGGGVYAEKSAALRLAGCDFTKNAAAGGGGLFLYMSAASLYNCVFMENTADKGGGAFNTGGELQITNGLFAGNNALEEGGGLSSGSTAHSDSRLNVTNCTFTANTTDYANRGAGVFSGDYSANIANSIISGNNSRYSPLSEQAPPEPGGSLTRPAFASDFVKSDTAPDPVYVNNIIGADFCASYGEWEDAGFDPALHLNMDYSLAPDDNPAVDRGSVALFTNAFDALKASLGENRPLAAYDARGCERFGLGVNAPIDLGAFEAFSPKGNVTPPSPAVTAFSNGEPYASGNKTNGLVEISAGLDIESMHNFPLIPRTGYLPLQIFCDFGDGKNSVYTKSIISESPETLRFYTALGTVAASSKVAFETMIDTQKPGVTSVTFDDSGNALRVPVSTRRIGVHFSNNIRATATSAARLFELADDGTRTEAADLSARAMAAGTELCLELTGASLKNGQKYVLDMNGYKDEYNNAMDSFQAYFVTEAAAGVAPAVTGLLAERDTLPHQGGEAALTITGASLHEIPGLAVTDGLNIYAATADESGSFATVETIRLPENPEETEYVYTFRVIAGGDATLDTGKWQNVSVAPLRREADTTRNRPGETGPEPAPPKEPAPPELTVNGSPLTLAGLDTNRDGHTVEVNSVDGSSSVIVRAVDLESLFEKNSRFTLNIVTPFGAYGMPVDLARRVPDYEGALRESGVNAEDMLFRLTMTDMSKNEGWLREAKQTLGDQSLKSGLTGLALDMLDADGKVIKSVSELREGVTIRLGVLPGFTPSAYTGAFCLSESGNGRKLMFVPHRLNAEESGKAVTAETYTHGVFFVAERKVSFDDIQGHWAQKSIEQMASLTLVSGVGENRFAPEEPLTRAEFAHMVAAALFLPKNDMAGPYPDTPKEAWYTDGVLRAKSAGLLSGLAGVGFSPNAPITREEAANVAAAALLYKSRAARNEPASLHMTFTDYQEINDGYAFDVQTVVSMNIMSGHNAEEFAPKSPATRAQGAVIIQKLLAALA